MIPRLSLAVPVALMLATSAPVHAANLVARAEVARTTLRTIRHANRGRVGHALKLPRSTADEKALSSKLIRLGQALRTITELGGVSGTIARMPEFEGILEDGGLGTSGRFHLQLWGDGRFAIVVTPDSKIATLAEHPYTDGRWYGPREVTEEDLIQIGPAEGQTLIGRLDSLLTGLEGNKYNLELWRKQGYKITVVREGEGRSDH